MKKANITIIAILCLTLIGAAFGQTIEVMMNPNPSPYISDWEARRETATLMVTNPSSMALEAKIMGSIMDDAGARMAATKFEMMPVMSFPPGVSTWYPEHIAPFEALKFYRETGDIEQTVTRTGMLPSGSYELCVELVDPFDGVPITSPPECRPFYITSYQTPVLLEPVDGEDFADYDPGMVTFRWTPVTPPPAGPVTYRVQVMEVLEGQYPEQAFRSNMPILERDVVGATQMVWPPDYQPPEPGRLHVWAVRALNTEGNPIGEPDGYSELFTFEQPTNRSTPQIYHTMVANTACESEQGEFSIGETTWYNFKPCHDEDPAGAVLFRMQPRILDEGSVFLEDTQGGIALAAGFGYVPPGGYGGDSPVTKIAVTEAGVRPHGIDKTMGKTDASSGPSDADIRAVEFDAYGNAMSVEVRGWNPKDKAMVRGRVKFKAGAELSKSVNVAPDTDSDIDADGMDSSRGKFKAGAELSKSVNVAPDTDSDIDADGMDSSRGKFKAGAELSKSVNVAPDTDSDVDADGMDSSRDKFKAGAELSKSVNVAPDTDSDVDADGMESSRGKFKAGAELSKSVNVAPDTDIEITDADGNVLAQTRTNESGEFGFIGLTPGEYQLRLGDSSGEELCWDIFDPLRRAYAEVCNAELELYIFQAPEEGFVDLTTATYVPSLTGITDRPTAQRYIRKRPGRKKYNDIDLRKSSAQGNNGGITDRPMQQSNLRKRPGRVKYGNITLKKGYAPNDNGLLTVIAQDANLSKADAKRALESFVSTTSKTTKKGDKISLVGFGSFTTSRRKSSSGGDQAIPITGDGGAETTRRGRNPQTGKEIKIAAKNDVPIGNFGILPENQVESHGGEEFFPVLTVGAFPEDQLSSDKKGDKEFYGHVTLYKSSPDGPDVVRMNKAELVEAIASEAGLSKADSKRALDGIVNHAAWLIMADMDSRGAITRTDGGKSLTKSSPEGVAHGFVWDTREDVAAIYSTGDYLDPDDDGDGILYIEQNPPPGEDVIFFDSIAQIRDYLDDDSDGDGLSDGISEDEDIDFLDPDDDDDGVPTATEGGDYTDDDWDDDGVADYLSPDEDPDYLDPDDDDDGISTATERGDYLDDDSDGDGLSDGIAEEEDIDFLDPDDDDDGVPTATERGDYLDDDSDGDGLSDGIAEEEDIDFLDPDDDDDGVPTATERGDYLDDDSDGDGLSDGISEEEDIDFLDPDDDDDGVPTATERGDYLDDDSDGDGLSDIDEESATLAHIVIVHDDNGEVSVCMPGDPVPGIGITIEQGGSAKRPGDPVPGIGITIEQGGSTKRTTNGGGDCDDSDYDRYPGRIDIITIVAVDDQGQVTICSPGDPIPGIDITVEQGGSSNRMATEELEYSSTCGRRVRPLDNKNEQDMPGEALLYYDRTQSGVKSYMAILPREILKAYFLTGFSNEPQKLEQNQRCSVQLDENGKLIISSQTSASGNFIPAAQMHILADPAVMEDVLLIDDGETKSVAHELTHVVQQGQRERHREKAMDANEWAENFVMIQPMFMEGASNAAQARMVWDNVYDDAKQEGAPDDGIYIIAIQPDFLPENLRIPNGIFGVSLLKSNVPKARHQAAMSSVRNMK